MDKKERNEDIQSRRKFFKKTIKKTLTILRAVLVVSHTIIAKVSDTETSCYYCCSAAYI